VTRSRRYDIEHSQSEERWITLGLAVTGQLVVVVHTFEEHPQEARIRIVLQAPIYLDPELRERLAAHARAKGISIDQLATELLKRELDRIGPAK
jgi:hypothetical protein